MKRYLYIIALLLLAPTFTACEDGLAPADELIGGIIDDSNTNNNTSTSSYTKLSDFSADSYPTSTTWTITDSSASLASFSGLRSALTSAASKGRYISLVFSNLEVMPNDDIYSSGALYDCDAILSVKLPVATSIGSYAFRNCSTITSIESPMATSIGDYAFYDCSALTIVKLPATTVIGSSAFRDCDALTTVELPVATEIGGSAFRDCDALTTIELPATTEIGSYAFAYCDALKSMSLATDDGVVISSISYYAFEDTTTTYITLTIGSSNSGYVSGNILSMGDFSRTFKEIILVDGDSVENKTYTTLADFSADSYPTDADTWTIYDTSAELSAFYGLRSALGSAYSAGREISLKFPNLEGVPTASSYSYGAFYNCDALTSVEFPVATEIGSWAFYSCNALTTVELPAATVIGSYAFWNCGALTTVELPVARVIGSGAFRDCDALTTVELPAATEIGSCAFASCDALTAIELATDGNVVLSSIDSYAFLSTTTSDITLTLGSANSGYVSVNTLTVGDFSETFKEIIMVDGDGNAEDTGDDDTEETSGTEMVYNGDMENGAGWDCAINPWASSAISFEFVDGKGKDGSMVMKYTLADPLIDEYVRLLVNKFGSDGTGVADVIPAGGASFHFSMDVMTEVDYTMNTVNFGRSDYSAQLYQTATNAELTANVWSTIECDVDLVYDELFSDVHILIADLGAGGVIYFDNISLIRY